MENTQLQRLESQAVGDALSVNELLAQVKLVQEVMRTTMREGEHYGKIPGCGDKPTLLQPGAQKLILTFRMNPDYLIEVIDMPKNHREYRVKCNLTNSGGSFIGAGVGSCSTMEGKWRFRVAPKTLTSNPVPKDYWTLRNGGQIEEAQKLIGGRGFSVKKNDDGQWMIAEGSSEKVEHDNPADCYNTCLKMAKKRALVDATLTRTAASDIFTQDIEDIKENMAVYSDEPHHAPAQEARQSSPAPQQQSAPRQQPAQRQTPSGDVIVTEAKLVRFKVVESKPGTPKPWVAWFCTFEDDAGIPMEAGTFDKKMGEKVETLQGVKVSISYKPGKQPGKFELLTIDPADDVPM